MSVGAAIGVIVAVAVVGIAFYVWYKRWKLAQHQKQLMKWAGEHIHEGIGEKSSLVAGDALLHGGRDPNVPGGGAGGPGSAIPQIGAAVDDSRPRAPTLVLPSEIEFASFSSAAHSFECSYPQAWTKREQTAPEEKVVVTFTCPEGEEVYKRFRVAWDDATWLELTPQSYAEHLLAAVTREGGAVLASRPGTKRGTHEAVYTVTDPEDGSRMKMLCLAVVAGRRAFNVTFCTDEVAYAALEPLARFMVGAFVAIPEVPRPLPETPANPAPTDLELDHARELSVRFLRPKAWTREFNARRRQLWFTCPVGEKSLKRLSVVVVDMSSVESADMLSDLGKQFERQAASERTRILQQSSVANGSDGSPAILFRCEGGRGLLQTRSSAMVGVKSLVDVSASPTARGQGAAGAGSSRVDRAESRVGEVFGYVMTFTTSAHVFSSYEPLARKLFSSLEIEPAQ